MAALLKRLLLVVLDVQFIPTEKGKYILVLEGYTYSQVGGRFFYCSSKHTGCKARVRVAAGRLVAAGARHNHAPPSQARCGNGAFVQLRPRADPPAFTAPAAALLPSLVASPQATAMALQALNFARIIPKMDLWNQLSNSEHRSNE